MRRELRASGRVPLASRVIRHHNGKWGPLAPAVWGGPAAWLTVAGILLLAGQPARDALGFIRPAITGGQWWRLLSCNFVHLGVWHLLLDALGLLLWVFLCGTRVSWPGWCWRSLILALGVGLGLYFFAPQVVGYVGLSGMIYGLLMLDLGRDVVVEADAFAALCVGVIVGRVAWAQHAGTPAWEYPLMGGEVISAAHVCGMVSAVVYVGVALAADGLRWRFGAAPFRIFGRSL